MLCEAWLDSVVVLFEELERHCLVDVKWRIKLFINVGSPSNTIVGGILMEIPVVRPYNSYCIKFDVRTWMR